MRVGKTRIIFRIDAEADRLQVYDMDFRGNIYKSLKFSSKTQSIALGQNSSQYPNRPEQFRSVLATGDRVRTSRAVVQLSSNTKLVSTIEKRVKLRSLLSTRFDRFRLPMSDRFAAQTKVRARHSGDRIF